MTNAVAHNIEALLFSEGGSLSKRKLMQLLDVTPVQLQEAIAFLRAERTESGVTLVESDTEVVLVVSQASATVVKDALERELGREIGDAGLEVLAIVLYRGPSTRARIDYIRGVNTASTIRALAARGLLERAVNPNDAREYLYRPTVELLAHLGVTDGRELPEYAKITSELAAFEESQKNADGPFENHVGGTDSTE